MGIIRAFYEEHEQAERERDRIWQSEQAARPLGEREAETAAIYACLDALREEHRQRRFVFDYEKVAVYRKAAEIAYHLAKTYYYDIVIGEDRLDECVLGVIQLRTYILACSKQDTKMADARENFFWLIQAADSVIVDADDDFVVLNFTFDLCDEVK